ncbi:MAG TPA: pyruvate dehydrogenase complex dihydrolipoamide acetyltransferase [Afifellaceae bacterium]|nr:pyruvate dehydrogenase complex dihydrolipoamide acetyltransferase [Afifellaceae bacterium]
MPINILMPALSPTMEVGNLAKWLVKEGDTVAAGDVIAEIETDKATMEVEAVDEGTVAKIVVAEGVEEVPVNQVIAILAEEGEDISAVEAPSKTPTSAGKAGGPSPQRGGRGAEVDEGLSCPLTGEVSARRADGGGEQTEEIAAPPAAPAPGQDNARIFASPLARRLAKENAIDLAALSGSGPHGRIVRSDIEAAVATGTGKAALAGIAPAAAAPAAMPDDQVLRLFEEGSYEAVKHDNMRKVIARRLVEAKSTIPHFYLTVDCEIDTLLDLRSQINTAAPVTDGKPAYKVSVNDMVIKALALALIAVPAANATWTSEAMLLHKHADIGVAVAIPGGLITPVVRHADEKPLSAIANEMKDLAGRARERKLMPEEYQGGSTAVSNLGMFGIKDFSAVINPPHSTILAVGAGIAQPVVRDGAVATATIMTVTLSTDHRAVDGALGAELLAAFRNYIENPMAMLV